MSKPVPSPKAAASWSKTMEDMLLGLNNFLTSMGLIEKDATIVPSMKDKEHSEKQSASMAELEQELIASGGGGVLLTDVRRGVLGLSPAGLRQKLRDGSLSAVLVLQAFQAKAIEEARRTNCITEFIPDATKWAESLDAMKFGKISDVQLPLHGFPISVKDNINIEGMDSTLGLRKRTNQPAESDAVIIQVLKKLGAIPFVKTNVPQLCLCFGCSNPVWGETINPHDSKRTCGGSSGGECALIAAGGSFLGIGTDFDGGVRLPAAFCGVVGLKPTAGRLSHKGIIAALPGMVGVTNTAGIIGRDSSIVVEATKALLSVDLNQYDSTTPPLSWREALYSGHTKKSLRIGWYDYDGIFPLTPGCKRAISETVSALRDQGHELVPFILPDPTEALKLYTDLVMADQGSTAYYQWKGENVDPDLSWYKQSSQVPAHVKSLAKPLMKHHFGEISADACIGAICSSYELWKKMIEKGFYTEMFLKSWKKEELDLILCPNFPMPAPPKEMVSKLTPASFYCLMYNLLDFPSATVPVSRETADDQKHLEEYTPTDAIHELIKEGTLGASGMPLTVQVVALPYCEEVLCRAVMEISKISNFKL